MRQEQARLRVGIVGAGIGRAHARGYQALPERWDLTAICDIDQARADALADEFSVPRVVSDLAELCRMDDLDVVDLCTPPSLHFEHIQQVLAATKHAICEKPLVGSLRQVDALMRASAACGRRMMPIFQYRFGHGLQKLKRLQAAGLTGDAYLSTVETAWRRRAEYYAVPWRGKWATELGGAVLSHAIHAHDTLLYVLGPVGAVFARTTTRVNPIEVEDCAAAALTMADGSLATLAVTLGSVDEITRYRFAFSGLTAQSNTRPYTSSGDPWTFTADRPELEPEIERVLAGFRPLPEGYAGQFYRFYDALRDGSEPPVTLTDAHRALELVAAIYHSARTDRDVTLPLDPRSELYSTWLPSALAVSR
jgi:predicted dehydrogenase